MACLDELVTATENLSTALTGSVGCGCGSSGGPSSSPAISETDTGDIQNPAGTPPQGYPDWATYRTKKCDIAEWIVTSLLSDIQWLMTKQLIELTAAALLIGFVAIIAAPVVLAILGALIAIGGYEQTILQDLEDAILAAYDDIKCALYTANNAAEAQTNVYAVLDAEIDVQTADTIARTLLKWLYRYWFDTTMVNLLFATYDEVTNVQIPTGGVCTDCLSPEWSVVVGDATNENLSIDGPGFTILSQLVNPGGGNRHRIHLLIPAGYCRTLSCTITGWTIFVGGFSFGYNCSGGIAFSTESNPAVEPEFSALCIGRDGAGNYSVVLQGGSTSQFTAVFVQGGSCT